jgi:alpha-1,3-glucosyltransferase
MFGDFEAQRHWMEVTRNVHVENWYSNTTDNDLEYWGLDYPPLTAYHSYLMGSVAEKVNASFVEIKTSRGIESLQVKLFMRVTALVSDVVFFFPPVLANPLASVILFFPGLMLIDHGHFQYNAVSLGLTLLAINSLKSKRELTGAFFFSLALNYKQMSLYHALPFFFYLLGNSFKKGFFKGSVKVFKIGFVVVATFGLLWLPWLKSVDLAAQVFRRLFPFNRGLYESKVANFWCTLNIFYKVNTPVMRDFMVKACMGTTLAASLPSCVHLLSKPTFRNFKLSLFIVSLAFFLFSFHVHEKSILLPALPACLLLNDYPDVSFYFLAMAASSMFPLFVLDELVLPYFATMMLFVAVYVLARRFAVRRRNDVVLVWFYSFTFLAAQVLNSLSLFVEPPRVYPDLFPVVISAFHACFFFLIFGCFYVEQLVGWSYQKPKKKFD